jgi:hypothetical protein
MGSGGGYRAIAQAPKHREMASIRRILGKFVMDLIYWTRDDHFEHLLALGFQPIVLLIAFFRDLRYL